MWKRRAQVSQRKGQTPTTSNHLRIFRRPRLVGMVYRFEPSFRVRSRCERSGRALSNQRVPHRCWFDYNSEDLDTCRHRLLGRVGTDRGRGRLFDRVRIPTAHHTWAFCASCRRRRLPCRAPQAAKLRTWGVVGVRAVEWW